MATLEIVETVCDVCERVSDEIKTYELRVVGPGQRLKYVDLCPKDARGIEALLAKL